MVAVLVLLMVFVVAGSRWSVEAQSSDTTVSVAPGETVPNGGPLLVPGEADSASSSVADGSNSDNTGTVVALVISGLLVVALLLALLTYWFWRNTRPTKPKEPGPAEG